MITCDLHTHTTYSDGKNTPEEMVLSAIDKGLKIIGISDHSYTETDAEYCMASAKTANYINEITALKEKYRDKIEVLCGIEQDYYSDILPYKFDYMIGSVHLVEKNGEMISVDFSAEYLKEKIEKHFNNDFYSFAECYFDTVGKVIEKTKADIIGHFDLISKFCEKENLFDQNNPRYISAWKKAVDKLLPYNVPFEINTGAISRGYRTSPYPSQPIYNYIKENGGKFILSSDSHSAENITFLFDKYSDF